MVNFWGDDEVEVTDTFSSGGGDFEVIPKNTNVLFEIEEIEIREANEYEKTDKKTDPTCALSFRSL